MANGAVKPSAGLIVVEQSGKGAQPGLFTETGTRTGQLSLVEGSIDPETGRTVTPEGFELEPQGGEAGGVKLVKATTTPEAEPTAPPPPITLREDVEEATAEAQAQAVIQATEGTEGFEETILTGLSTDVTPTTVRRRSLSQGSGVTTTPDDFIL